MKLINFDVTLISFGYDFCVCVCKNGVFSWGNNTFGQLGIGNNDIQYLPRQIEFFKNPEEIISLCCGAYSCVCHCKSEILSWGINHFGELGIGNRSNQSSPQKILFFQKYDEIISICCGAYFCVCVCKNEVFSWGHNYAGQLGIGNFESQFFPQQILFFKKPQKITSISCGRDFCICIYKNEVFSWGRNCSGELGIGNSCSQSSPQQILFFKNTEEIISLCCGGGFCVCICNNGVFSWGSNLLGQLGIGNNDNQFSPQQISFFENPKEIISLCCGNEFCVCICKNGIFKWGNNAEKQLQIGYKIHQKTNILSPQRIFLEKNIESFYEYSFPQTSTYNNRMIKLLLMLIREFSDPDKCLLGKYYLPLDLFKLLLKLI